MTFNLEMNVAVVKLLSKIQMAFGAISLVAA